MRAALTLLALVTVASSALAQPERYELGQHLKAFEKQWDKTTDPKLRAKAVEGLPKLTGLFFTNQFGEAGRTLDEARWILEGKEPSDDEKWAQSLYVDPGSRYQSANQTQLEVTIKAFYPVKSARPKSLQVKLSMPGTLEDATVPITEIPQTVWLKYRGNRVNPKDGLSNEDSPLRVELLLGNEPVGFRQVGLSIDGIAKNNFEAGKHFVAEALKSFPTDSLEFATVNDRIERIKDLAKGTIPETDFPAIAMLNEVAQINRCGQAGKSFFTDDRSGQFLISIPTGKSNTPCRLLVPKGLNAEKPIPMVVALHGAGGSENLFFEGYGDGQIVKLCEQRGWMLLAPRSGLSLVGGGPPVGELVDALAKRYPIDPRRVFLVGHSMGAMQAIDAVQKYPGRFAGLAALGGGGRVRKAEPFAQLPTFLGVGEKDFALPQTRALKQTLTEGGAQAVVSREYPGLEHLLICREALPDAFALFDKVK